MTKTSDFPYINRELSWLDFNARVLEEAYEKDNPVPVSYTHLWPASMQRPTGAAWNA